MFIYNTFIIHWNFNFHLSFDQLVAAFERSTLELLFLVNFDFFLTKVASAQLIFF